MSAALSDGLLTMLALLLGLFVGYLASWLQLACHEVAHAGTCILLGGKVVRVQIGSGSRVWPLRVRGIAFELRLGGNHGLAHGHFLRTQGFRWRYLCYVLAGPIASTMIAAPLVWWRLTTALDGVGFAEIFAQWSLVMVAWLTGISAILAWWPGTFAFGRSRPTTDTALFWHALRMPHDEVATTAAMHELLYRQEVAWRHFLDGEPALALERLRAIDGPDADRWQFELGEAIIVWALDGPDAALEIHARCEAGFEAWRSSQDETTPRSHESGAFVRRCQEALVINRLFLLLQADAPAADDAADELRRYLQARHRDPATLRTLGLYSLEAGEHARGLRYLQEAFRRQESPWHRALCALYLAYGHALTGDSGRARRMLAKCEHLDPQCPALPRYGPLIEQRLSV